MAIELEQENQDWINAFIAKHKRKPRILHLSNVANNAYNNAKLLNECGIENHVLAYNDCFAMGCPEWEDADFDSEIEDMWHPKWDSYNLKGFTRPTWFVQGELKACVKYLTALCTLDEKKTDVLFANLSKDVKSIVVKNILRPIWKKVRQLMVNLDSSFNMSCIKRVTVVRNFIVSGINRCFYEKDCGIGRWEVDKKLVNAFKQEFPERTSPLSEIDFRGYYYPRAYLHRVMDYYDIVIGYAYEGLYPLMMNKPYFAFEHGTIRDIPYQDDTQGRLCSIVYRKATHVFVTNIDCVPSADFLAPKKYSVINHPYDDDQPLSIKDDWQLLRQELQQALDADMLLFHPTRQDWVANTGYADKANDVFLKAFGSLRQQGMRIGLICCAWGANVEQSKQLLEEFGVSKHVRWIKPQGVIAFTRMCKCADMVVDQFKLGGFGGVTFKALASGTPVMSNVDVKQVLSRYAESPPIINCKTEADITSQLAHLFNNRDELKKIGVLSRDWIKKFHNKSETVNIQLNQFRHYLPVN